MSKIGGHNKHTEEWARFAIPEFTNKKYIYAGGYTGIDNSVEIQCIECGEVFTRSMTTIRHGKKIICPGCVKKAKQAKEIEKSCRNIKPINIPNIKEMRLSYCKECGSAIVDVKKKVYCSEDCKRRSINRKKDGRLNKDNVVDKDITLQKLFMRDNGKCYLCGCDCDYHDYYKHEGHFLVGNTYPSIEHVKPLSKGGKHAWDNVKLACFRCNTLKGARLSYE